ncbi:MAG: hypothetical protein LUF35_14410 [Lachnospiraceae bacterium]|nr:hypothetical protein [Lachnospiraceae bacterium]
MAIIVSLFLRHQLSENPFYENSIENSELAAGMPGKISEPLTEVHLLPDSAGDKTAC